VRGWASERKYTSMAICILHFAQRYVNIVGMDIMNASRKFLDIGLKNNTGSVIAEVIKNDR